MTAVVQAPAPVSQTAQNPSASFPVNVTLGNLLVLFFNWANTSGAVSSVTDSLGNVWGQIDFSQIAGSVRTLYCFSAPVTIAGACTVTIHTDASRAYSFSLYEVQGITNNLDGSPVHRNDASGTSTAPATGTLVTANSTGGIVFANNKSSTISASPTSPWVSESVTNHGTSYQIVAAPGSFSATWTAAAGNWSTMILAFRAPAPPPPTGGGVTAYPPRTYMRMLGQQNVILGGSGQSTSDNEFTLIARNNKLLGGPMASPAATIMSMLSKQNKLVGGIGARTNDNQYWLYVRTLKQLGGTAYPSDNVLTLLNKINKLI